MNNAIIEQPNIENTDDVLRERYALLPDELTDLIEYMTVALVVEQISTTYDLTQIQSTLLENEILMVLLLFLPRESFKERIQDSLQIDASLAATIGDEIEKEIFSLVNGILTAANKGFVSDTQIEPAPLQESEVPTPTAMKDPEPTAIAPEPDLSERISALRTMQGDAERIHGYGAYRRRNEPQSNQPQSSTQPLAAPPRYVDTDEGKR